MSRRMDDLTEDWVGLPVVINQPARRCIPRHEVLGGSIYFPEMLRLNMLGLLVHRHPDACRCRLCANYRTFVGASGYEAGQSRLNRLIERKWKWPIWGAMQGDRYQNVSISVHFCLLLDVSGGSGGVADGPGLHLGDSPGSRGRDGQSRVHSMRRSLVGLAGFRFRCIGTLALGYAAYDGRGVSPGSARVCRQQIAREATRLCAPTGDGFSPERRSGGTHVSRRDCLRVWGRESVQASEKGKELPWQTGWRPSGSPAAFPRRAPRFRQS